MFQAVPDAPLIMAANRDERTDRPAVAMTVLREQAPRVLGGRDELAGGTWLAVNEYGVVAGLTNQPSAAGRDPAKRSRGELPLAFAACTSAAGAVSAVSATLDPSRYNPCWMLVGDRESLFFLGLGGGSRPEVEQLGPGLHVLENAPLQPPSPKAGFVRRLAEREFAAQPDNSAASALVALETVLRDHQPAVPGPLADLTRTEPSGRVWPPSLSAACVHSDGYGTRSAMTIVVPPRGLPEVRVADGKPCENPLLNATGLWAAGSMPVTA
jgi:uncharacterized protein with NRDE domain